MIKGHFGCGRKILSLLVRCAFLLVLVHATAGGVALAQTPHSVNRNCGYPGGPTCPPPLPMTGPWFFSGKVGSYQIPEGMHSWADIDNWVYTFEMPHYYVACSFGALSPTEISGWPVYQLGIESGDAWDVSLPAVYAENYNPPCSINTTLGGQITMTRWVACPPGTSANANNQCGPTGTPVPLKQQGYNCLPCKGKTVKGDPVITSRTDFNGNVTQYTYDPTTNLETSRTEAYGAPQARTITTQWDPNWRQPDLITEPGRTTAYRYDGLGNVLTKTVTDTTTNATRTWIYTYDSYGRMLTAEDPRENSTTYTYYTCTAGSQCGELDTVTDALGHVTTYNTYDSNGRPLSITDPNGAVTTLTYDSRGRLTSRSVAGETTTFTYYPTGLLEQVTLPDSSSLSYIYNGAHRLTQVSDGLGNKIVYTAT